MKKMTRVVSKLNEHKFQGYIEADGGVTLENAGACFADGARAFVGGSAIIGQSDIRGVIREFRDVILHTRRRMLLQKANDLSGKNCLVWRKNKCNVNWNAFSSQSFTSFKTFCCHWTFYNYIFTILA